MDSAGYSKNGDIRPFPYHQFVRPHKEKRVLIIARKMLDRKVDGTKRYVDLLLKAFNRCEIMYGLPFDLVIQTGSIRSLIQYFDSSKDKTQT